MMDRTGPNNSNWKGGISDANHPNYKNHYYPLTIKNCSLCGMEYENRQPQREVMCRSCAAKKPKGFAAFNKIFHGYKRNAKERGFCFELTKEQMMVINKQDCHYCGSEPNTTFTIKRHDGRKSNGAYIYNGMDRFNNDEGYTLTNTVPCCRHCNKAKWTMSNQDFLQHIKKIYEFNFGEKE